MPLFPRTERRFRATRRAHSLIIPLLAALLLLTGGLPARAGQTAPTPAPPPNPPTDRIIVRFVAGPAATAGRDRDAVLDRVSAAAGLRLTVVRPMSGGATVLRLPTHFDEATVAAMAARIAALPEVEYAEPDAIMQIVAAPPLPAAPANGLTPDDSRFGDQWHYRYVPGVEEGLNLLPAWGITTGSADTVVAVLDTGLRPHADLAGRTVPGYDFISSLVSSQDGDGRDNDPSDPGDWATANLCYQGSPPRSHSTWHGTHVAGTIAANSNNGSDVAGVNWHARILPVRVLGSCGGYLGDIADAIRWAAGLPEAGVPPNANPAAVVNLSLGGSGACGPTYQQAFDDLAAAGVVAVVAAGNGSTNVAYSRPANCNHVIAVAATAPNGRAARYTNGGALIDIAAPGGEMSYTGDPSGVLSTYNAGVTAAGADSVDYMQGTSMAAPHVAGLVSLLLGERPDLTPAEVLDILQSTARAFPGGGYCTTATCGAGIVDAFAALSALPPAEDLDAPALLSPADDQTLTAAGVTFAWSAVAGATGYHLQVATDNAFASLTVDETGLPDPTAAATLPGEGTYYWRARAVGDGSPGPWSAVWSFTVVYPCVAPAAPTLLHPADGSTAGDATPDLLWQPVAGATRYDIRLSDQPDVASPLVSDNSATPGYTVPAPLDEGETYYWRVRARIDRNACSEIGPWSEVWSFTLDAAACPAPAAPALALPADGSTVSAPPALSWSAAAGATGYEVRIGGTPDLAAPLRQATVTGTAYDVDLTLAGGATYYWAVRAANNDGACDTRGEWSAVWRFTYAAPQPETFSLFLPGAFGQ